MACSTSNRHRIILLFWLGKTIHRVDSRRYSEHLITYVYTAVKHQYYCMSWVHWGPGPKTNFCLKSFNSVEVFPFCYPLPCSTYTSIWDFQPLALFFLCMTVWGTRVQSPGGYLCETGILLLALSCYIGDPDMIDHCGLVWGGLRPEPSLGRRSNNVIIPLDLTQLFCPGFTLAAGPPSGFTIDIVGCWGGALWRACNLTAFTPCLTGPVNYPFVSHHEGPWFNPQGGTYLKPGFSCYCCLATLYQFFDAETRTNPHGFISFHAPGKRQPHNTKSTNQWNALFPRIFWRVYQSGAFRLLIPTNLCFFIFSL